MSGVVNIDESEAMLPEPSPAEINNLRSNALFITMAPSPKTDAIKEGEAVAFRGRFYEVHLTAAPSNPDQPNVALTLLDICSIASPEKLEA